MIANEFFSRINQFFCYARSFACVCGEESACVFLLLVLFSAMVLFMKQLKSIHSEIKQYQLFYEAN